MVLCAAAERPIEIVPEPEHPIPYHRDRRRCPLLETTVWMFAQAHEMPETAHDATTPWTRPEVVPVKFMPAIVTEAPASPFDGSKPVIVGGGGGGTDGMINGDELIAPARRGCPK